VLKVSVGAALEAALAPDRHTEAGQPDHPTRHTGVGRYPGIMPTGISPVAFSIRVPASAGTTGFPDQTYPAGGEGILVCPCSVYPLQFRQTYPHPLSRGGTYDGTGPGPMRRLRS